jgi:hypothetical protein
MATGKSICGNKFQYTVNKTIILPVKLENLPNELQIESNTLLLQSSFHVSLVCIGKIIEKHNISVPDFENKIINDFCKFCETNKIEVLEYDDFKFVVQDDLKTVIVMCKVSNLDRFFGLINKKYELNIEYPPTHVTLYILPDKHGIFLTDASDIKNLTKPILNPIGRTL